MAIKLFIRCKSCGNPFQRIYAAFFDYHCRGLITDLTLTLREERSSATYTRVVHLKEKKPKANHFGNGHLVFCVGQCEDDNKYEFSFVENIGFI